MILEIPDDATTKMHREFLERLNGLSLYKPKTTFDGPEDLDGKVVSAPIIDSWYQNNTISVKATVKDDSSEYSYRLDCPGCNTIIVRLAKEIYNI